MRLGSIAAWVGCLCSLASISVGQSLNIRFGTPGSKPTAAYAAAGLPGAWNSFEVPPGYAHQPLVGLQGITLAATFYQYGSSSILAYDNPLTSGEDEKLMDSMILSTNSPTDGCFWVEGLTLGPYEVTLYAMTPNDPSLLSRTRVDNGSPGPVLVGGSWPGHHQSTVTYARFTVTTTDGVIAFHDGLAGAMIQSGINGVQFRFLGACESPIVYCIAKINSFGCTPAIGSSGTASASSPLPFLVTATSVLNNKSGLLFYGLAAGTTPFQGGTLCITPPLSRTPVQASGGSPTGTDCSGTYGYDMNARIQSGIDPNLVQGAVVYGQYWSRDPASPSATGLTNALCFTICP
jgi:hypothetical protein